MSRLIISKLDIAPKECRKNFKHIHTTITSLNFNFRKNNEVTNITPCDIHSSEQSLPRHMLTKLAQFRAKKPRLLQSYLHTVNPETYMPQRPLCLSHTHMSLITYLTVVKYQHNATPIVCRKSF